MDKNGCLTDDTACAAADLCKDGQIDVFDEIALRQELMNSEALY